MRYWKFKACLKLVTMLQITKDYFDLMASGFRLFVMVGVSAVVVSGESRADDTGQYGMAAADIGATLMFQREIYRGVLTDHGESYSSSFLRRAEAKLKVPIFDDTIFKLKLKARRSDEVVVSDAFVNWEFDSDFAIQAGRYDPEFGLELTGSTAWSTAVERSSIYDLLVISGDGSEGQGMALNYSSDAFHGNMSVYHIPDTNVFSGRFVSFPIHENSHRLLFGFSASFSDDSLSDDGEIKTTLGFWSLGDSSDTNSIKLAKDVGDEGIIHNREKGLELAYQYRNALFQAEYIRREFTSQDRQIDTRAGGYSLQLAYTLTGEYRRFKRSNATYLGVDGGTRQGFLPGAWELYLKYDYLKAIREQTVSVNDTTSDIRRATVSTLGVNWYWKEDLKISTGYSWVYAPADANDEDEIRGSGLGVRATLKF